MAHGSSGTSFSTSSSVSSRSAVGSFGSKIRPDGLPNLERLSFGVSSPRVRRIGLILDPNNGRTYQLLATYEPDGTLRARIFKGIPLVGKTEILRRADIRELVALC